MSDTADVPPPEKPPVEKPERNWRGFLKEFGTIVLGVSVALAAQQAAEWWNWRGQVAETRTMIASELAVSLRAGIFRLRAGKCIERRLDELGAILDTASRTGQLPPLGDIGTPPRGVWLSGAWEGAQASQVAVHFPRQELAAVTRVYKFIQKADEFSTAEITQWNELYAMVGPGRRLDAASEARLRSAMSQARVLGRTMTAVGQNIIVNVKALNPSFSDRDLAVIAQGEREPGPTSRNDYNVLGTVCLPIEKAPATYGQGGFRYIPTHNDENLKKLPKFGEAKR